MAQLANGNTPTIPTIGALAADQSPITREGPLSDMLYEGDVTLTLEQAREV